jgi:hypothetical protein
VLGRMVRGPIADSPLLRVQYWWFGSYFQMVHRSPADSPPGACGRSAWCCLGLLSPLLLEFFFHFGIVWGLFLGLVAPL